MKLVSAECVIPEEGEFPGYSWSVDRWMLPSYCLNVGFRRGACHPAAVERVKLRPCKRRVGGWTRVQEVRTPGSRCWLGPHRLSRPPALHPAARVMVLQVGCPRLQSVQHQPPGVGRKHGTSVKTHLQSEEIPLFVGSSCTSDEGEDDHTSFMHVPGFPDGASGEESSCSAGDTRDVALIPGSGRSLEEEMATPPVLLPGESHGWRSLVGYTPWGRKESDMTERLHYCYSLLRYTERMYTLLGQELAAKVMLQIYRMEHK